MTNPTTNEIYQLTLKGLGMTLQTLTKLSSEADTSCRKKWNKVRNMKTNVKCDEHPVSTCSLSLERDA